MDSTMFQIFHKHFFAIIYAWSCTSPKWNNHITETWCTIIEAGITEESTWNDVKELMQINTFHQYYLEITTCGPLYQHYDFYWQDVSIYYSVLHHYIVSICDRTYVDWGIADEQDVNGESSINGLNDVLATTNNAHHFYHQLRDVSNNQSQLASCEQCILTQLNHASGQLAANFAQHDSQLKQVTVEIVDQICNIIAEITDDAVTHYCSRLTEDLIAAEKRQAFFIMLRTKD
jgi:hypothetical protein